MAQHVKILGILHIALGALSVCGGLIVLAVMGGLAGIVGAAADSDSAFIAMPILAGLGGIAFLVLMALGLPGIIAGWGLLNFRPWARVVTIALSAFDLFHIPFGTALGIYGFWVLLSVEGEQLFRPPQQYAAR
ncbi:MAG: hypothetical protein ABI693_30605 [Bryobacteraceae bacterium]